MMEIMLMMNADGDDLCLCWHGYDGGDVVVMMEIIYIYNS